MFYVDIYGNTFLSSLYLFQKRFSILTESWAGKSLSDRGKKTLFPISPITIEMSGRGFWADGKKLGISPTEKVFAERVIILNWVHAEARLSA